MLLSLVVLARERAETIAILRDPAGPRPAQVVATLLGAALVLLLARRAAWLCPRAAGLRGRRCRTSPPATARCRCSRPPSSWGAALPAGVVLLASLAAAATGSRAGASPDHRRAAQRNSADGAAGQRLAATWSGQEQAGVAIGPGCRSSPAPGRPARRGRRGRGRCRRARGCRRLPDRRRDPRATSRAPTRPSARSTRRSARSACG